MSLGTIDLNGLTFSVPQIAPKVYIVKGPSGWPETFKRDVVDRELAGFTHPAPVDALVDLFVTRRQLAEKPEPTSWHTVIGFLGRTMNCPPNAVPHTVGIAFWGRVVLASLERGAN